MMQGAKVGDCKCSLTFLWCVKEDATWLQLYLKYYPCLSNVREGKTCCIHQGHIFGKAITVVFPWRWIYETGFHTVLKCLKNLHSSQLIVSSKKSNFETSLNFKIFMKYFCFYGSSILNQFLISGSSNQV